MARKKHQTKHEFTNKAFHGKYTNRIVMTSRYVALKKLKKALKDSDLVHKLMDGYCTKIVYYLDADHDKMMSIITDKVKPKRIDLVNRPFNDRAKSEMVGDKHLVVVKNLPFKKYRYKVTLKSFGEDKPDLGFLKAQSELGTVRLGYMLNQYLLPGGKSWHYYHEDYFYVEDEATMSMSALLFSDQIKKIYIYKTFDEMKEPE